MKKLVLSAIVLFAGMQASAMNKQVRVDCQTPGDMAGAPTIRLYGQLDIVVSPTTGMTKLKDGSFLTISRTQLSRARRTQVTENILVSGTYYDSSAPRIDANQEPSSPNVDDRTYSSIEINGTKSSIFEIRGSLRHPLICKIQKGS